jgi:phosphatidate cytidylyltransferase
MHYFVYLLFLVGAALLVRINRGKTQVIQRKNWIKFAVYLIYVAFVLETLKHAPELFRYLLGLLASLAAAEIFIHYFNLKNKTRSAIPLVFWLPLLYFFSQIHQFSYEKVAYVFVLSVVFDAFSQLFGQLLGGRKLVPKLSPQKTIAGFGAGVSMVLLTGFFIPYPFEKAQNQTFELLLSCAFLFLLGDLYASFCKRKLVLKDFSSWIPGHGGIMDRLDSFIVGSLVLYFL